MNPKLFFTWQKITNNPERVDLISNHVHKIYLFDSDP